MNKILFRADGNGNIGAGHIMRCMSIAIAARKMGFDCCFVVADDCFRQLLIENGFRVEVLNSNYEQMNDELDCLCEMITKEKPNRIVVDSYYVSCRYLQKLKTFAKLVYIDDVMSFPYPVDILINYNIFASHEDYIDLYGQEKKPQLLLGSMYAPLREEFQEIETINISNRVENVLFSAGGADPERMALRFVERVISDRHIKDIKFHVVLGSFEPDKEIIEKIAEMNSNIIVYNDVKRMSEVMKKCELAVSAAGSTLYELCSCGIPTITYILADNQIFGAEKFEELGIMCNAGDERTDKNILDAIIEGIYSLSFDVEKRKKMQINARAYIDGKGANRIALEIAKGDENK